MTGSLSIGGLEGSSDEGTNIGPPEGYVDFSFPVTYSGDEVAGGFDVNWSVSYPTAEPKAEAADIKTGYTSGTIHFDGLDQPGGETQNIVVRVVADRLVELDEQFKVDLSAPAGGLPAGVTIATGTATATITNDDEAVITTRINQVDTSFLGASEGNTGTNTSYVVKFYMNNTVDTDISFNYDFFDYDATQGTDYTVSSDNGTVGSWYMEGYHLGVELTVTFTGDNTVEMNEDFSLILSNLQTGGRNVKFASAQATDFLSFEIQNDDTARILVVVDGNTSPDFEKNSGTHTVTFELTLDKAVDVPVSVDVYTVAGTASAVDGDYVYHYDDVQFAGTANEKQYFTVQVAGDTKVELDETFEVMLGSVQASGRDVSASTSAGSATATILDDDSALVSISGNSAYEGNSGTNNLGLFTISLNHPVAHDVVVTVTVWGITASAQGSLRDFNLPQNGLFTVTIPAGQTSTVLNIPVIGDTRNESNETIGALISAVDADEFDVSIDDNNDEATGTILDEVTDLD